MIQIILAIVIFLNISLSIFVFVQDKKSWNNRLFSLMAFFAATWTLANLMTGIYDSPFWLKNSYATGALVLGMGLIWTFYITEKSLDRKKIIITTFLSLAFFIGSYIEGFIAADYGEILAGGAFTGTPGYGLYLYGLAFLLVAGTICYKLFTAQKNEPDTQSKLQLQSILYGALAPLIVSALTSFIFPIFSIYQFAGFDSIGFLIFLSFIAYAIFKHHLLDIKVITTELFIFVIWVFMLARLFLVNTLQEQLIAAGLLIALIIFGILLIRSVLREVKNREQIETLNVQLEKSLEELRKIDELKTEFVSLASHQLRTPLTPIKGYADMLRKGDFGGPLENPEQRKAVDSIYLSAQRMVDLIDDLLDVSKLEKEGGFTYNFQISNPEPVIKKIVDEMQNQAKDKGVALTFGSNLPGETAIKFDPSKFIDALGNVINNAVKYTKEGNVWVTLTDDDGNAVISVKDTGVGISPEDIDKLFQKFFRGKEVSRLATEGAGLGLYFTKRVIEDHGGHIEAKSEGQGKGSEFIITLPKATEQTQVQAQPPGELGQDVPKPPQAPSS